MDEGCKWSRQEDHHLIVLGDMHDEQVEVEEDEAEYFFPAAGRAGRRRKKKLKTEKEEEKRKMRKKRKVRQSYEGD